MKYIKTYEGLFDFFRKKSEDDNIALEFIKRLKRVKGISPYTIKINTEGTEDGEQYWTRYKIDFDDTPIRIVKVEADRKYKDGWDAEYLKRLINLGAVKKNNHILYALVIENVDEYVIASVYVLEELFELAEKVFKENKKAMRIKRIQDEINPAADLLNNDLDNEDN